MSTSTKQNRASVLFNTIVLCLTFGAAVSTASASSNQVTKNNPVITEQLAANLKSYYGREAQALTINGKFCREDNYCVLTHEPFDVIVHGKGIVKVSPLTRVPMTDNVEMCALAFATLTGTKMEDAIRTVGIIFGAAIQQGSFSQRTSGVKISVVENSTSDLACQIVR
ncbi:MAG: hypothetical protein ABJK39_13075 [Hyphomicrobiales bacterium]